MSQEVGISSPWVTFAREVKALFEKDPEIRVEYDNDEPGLKVYVANSSKADALGKLLPEEKRFGNVKLAVSVIPANEGESRADLFRRAFAGNAAVTGFETIQDVFANEISYVIFEPEVVQFFNDNLGDVNGLCSTLYQDVANVVFDENHDGVFFCTAPVLATLDAPLGEWP